MKGKESKLQPQWEGATLLKLSTGTDILLVPTPQYALKHKNLSAYRAFIYYLSADKASITSAELVEIVGEKKYMEDHIDKLLVSIREEKILDFNGTILEYGLNYKYIKGEKYVNGVNQSGVAQINSKPQKKSNNTSTFGDYATNTVYETCTDVYMDYTYYTNGVVTGTESVYMYSYCTYTESGQPKTDVVSLGGGGSVEGTGGDPGTFDLASDCDSWEFMAVAGGNYQACGVDRISLDYTTMYFDRDGNFQIDPVDVTFNAPYYFEYPRIRANGEVIPPGEAAELMASLKDRAEELIEEMLGSQRKPSNAYIERKFIEKYRGLVERYGGRITSFSNYGVVPVKEYGKALTTEGCK